MLYTLAQPRTSSRFPFNIASTRIGLAKMDKLVQLFGSFAIRRGQVDSTGYIFFFVENFASLRVGFIVITYDF